MNGFLLAFLVTVVGVAAVEQQQLQWLPQIGFQPCLWCSGRYYRQSFQGDRNFSSSRLNDYQDLARRAGWFYDVTPAQPVRNERGACKYFIDRYNNQRGPILSNLIESFINETFFGRDEKVDYSDKPHPLAFQCCHYKYGGKLMKEEPPEQSGQQQQQLETTTVPQEQSSSSTTLSSLAARSGNAHIIKNDTKISKKGKEQHLNATALASGTIVDVPKKGKAKLNETEVIKDNKKNTQHDKLQDGQAKKNLTKSHEAAKKDNNKLTARTNVREQNSAQGEVQNPVARHSGDQQHDEYKAEMPRIFVEGYDCNALTQQLYAELSQPTADRQQAIQRAMQEQQQHNQQPVGGGFGFGGGVKTN